MIRFAEHDGGLCPVVTCDACHRVIDADNPGILAYDPQDDRRQWHAHKGRCDRTLDPLPSRLFSRDLGQWVAQLGHNYAHPMGVAAPRFPCSPEPVTSP